MTSEEPVAFFLVSFVRMRRNRRIHPPNSSAVPLCYSVLLRRLHFWPRLTPILCVSVEQHFLSCWSLLFVFFFVEFIVATRRFGAQTEPRSLRTGVIDRCQLD